MMRYLVDNFLTERAGRLDMKFRLKVFFISDFAIYKSLRLFVVPGACGYLWYLKFGLYFDCKVIYTGKKFNCISSEIDQTKKLSCHN